METSAAAGDPTHELPHLAGSMLEHLTPFVHVKDIPGTKSTEALWIESLTCPAPPLVPGSNLLILESLVHTCLHWNHL